MSKPFANALAQLEKAAQIGNFSPAALERLKEPQKIITKQLSVEMDDGTTKLFDAYRVQYNNARGPFKGGIRFHPQTDLDEVKALAFWMTIKTAAVNIPYGGGKGGVTVDASSLSQSEIERLSRAYARAFADNIGPNLDVPAPDVYTTPQIMGWIMDEYCQIKNAHLPGVITGKPLSIGGSAGRGIATAQGGFYILELLREKLSLTRENTRIAIQGFGNAGATMAKLAFRAGYKVVAVSDSRGGIYKTDGINIDELNKHKRETGTVQIFAGSNNLSNEELLVSECEILIPAALENQINETIAGNIKAHTIIELANGPTTPEADEVLKTRDIILVPDVLANAGGVTVSYFEWVQNLSNYYWTEKEVMEKLEPIMTTSFHAAWKLHEEKSVDLRTAVFVLAVERIVTAMHDRGWC